MPRQLRVFDCGQDPDPNPAPVIGTGSGAVPAKRSTLRHSRCVAIRASRKSSPRAPRRTDRSVIGYRLTVNRYPLTVISYWLFGRQTENETLTTES